MRPLAGFVSLLAVGLACASIGGVREAELPEEPIAFVYLTQEEARRRAEDYADERARAGEGRGPDAARAPRGGRNDLVVSEDNVGEIFSRLLGRADEDEDGPQGRLALLHPRTGEVELIEAARRGAVPLSWSRDRRGLLFSQPIQRDFQVFEYSVEDGTVRAVTLGPTSHTQACYGPEGRIVVAAVDIRETPLRSYIAISQPGGRGPFTALTRGPGDHSPVCQPDGDGIAFVREESPPRAEIYFLQGAELRRLSPGRHPRFSPDGEWLAFAAPAKRELRIWRIRPDGSGRAPIGRGMRHEARPTFSPDGRLVAYVAGEQRPRRHLYLRRFDGTGDRILFSNGDGEFPVW